LKNHSDTPADFDGIDGSVVQVLFVVQDQTFDLCPDDEIIHAIQRPDERALAASGRPDDGSDPMRRNL
jgi:hypothetical protein